MADGSERLHGLRDFAQAVSSSDSLSDLVDRGAAVALALLDADSVSVSRFDPAHGQVRVLRNLGDLAAWEQEWPADAAYSVHDYPQAEATATGHTHSWVGSVDDPTTSEADADLLRRMGKRHAAAFSVLVADQVWGEVYVTRCGQAFGPEELTTGLTFAGLLSSGLSRLDLLADLSRLAYTDPLTALANRRAADEWLERRLAAPEPFPPVSVVLCDINGLKRVNDAFGHTAGDQLVRLVAGRLSAIAGDLSDVLLSDALAARIGGDEFVLLVDGATQQQVDAAVARIAGVRMPHGAGIAVGAATTVSRPAGAETVTTATRALMRLADAAQYRHKQTQRLSSSTLSTGSAAVAVLYPQGEDDLADRVLDRLDSGTDRSVAWRLQVVSDAMAQAFDVASWWVSRHVPGGSLVDVLGRMVRDDSRGELAQVELVSGTEFDPADFPATARALEGGSYFASLTEGESSERAFLARMGYVSTLAAGERCDDGVGWLLEMFGDPQTSAGLSVARPLLRSLVRTAVCGADVNR